MEAPALPQAEQAAGFARRKVQAAEPDSANGVLFMTLEGLLKAQAVSGESPTMLCRVARAASTPAGNTPHSLTTVCSWQGKSKAQVPQGRTGEGVFPHVLSGAMSLLGSLEQGRGMGRGSLSPGSPDPPPSLCNPGGVFQGHTTIKA